MFDRSESFDMHWAGPTEVKPRVYRTQSEKDTWYAVVVENEYRAPNFGPDDVVIDIGAHIGSFSYLAYLKGSRSIYAFEVDPWHHEAAMENIKGKEDGIGLYHCAMVRGDDRRASQYYYNGSWNAFGVIGQEVESRSLDEVIEQVDEGNGIRFIKLDCEGGEWPILYTSKKLDRVQQIAGEYHIMDASVPELQHLPHPLHPEALKLFLESQGFMVEVKPSNATLGLFFARRPVKNTECPACGYTF